MRRWVFWGERVLGSPWRWVVVLVGLVFALLGLLMTGLGGAADVVTWDSVLLGVLACAGGLAFLVWGLLSRVHLHPDRLVHRAPSRRRSVRVEDVVAVGVQTVDGKVVWEASAPVLRLGDGHEVALMGLAGISHGSWRTPLLRRNVAALLAWWGGDPEAFDALPAPGPDGTDVASSTPPPTARAPRPAPDGDLDGPFRSGPSRRRA